MDQIRTYYDGVRQETLYDRIGRAILIKETDSQNRLLRTRIRRYKRRRSQSIDEQGRVTRYIYDNRLWLIAVMYPCSA
jgi:hypothetical protein